MIFNICTHIVRKVIYVKGIMILNYIFEKCIITLKQYQVKTKVLNMFTCIRFPGRRYKTNDLSLDDDILKLLNNCGTYKVCEHIFNTLNLKFTNTDYNVVQAIIGTYANDIDFHNLYHALDVMHIASILLKYSCIFKSLNEQIIRLFLYTALGHDADHKGITNNEYALLDTKSHCSSSESSIPDYNVEYSKGSYNENHHIYILLEILKTYQVDISELDVAYCIAFTDLKNHIKFIHEQEDSLRWKLTVMLKLADIGHIFKPWKTHVRYVNAIYNENKQLLSEYSKAIDTIQFNKLFVHPLLEMYSNHIHRKHNKFLQMLVNRYEIHMNTWNEQKLFYEDILNPRTNLQ